MMAMTTQGNYQALGIKNIGETIASYKTTWFFFWMIFKYVLN